MHNISNQTMNDFLKLATEKAYAIFSHKANIMADQSTRNGKLIHNNIESIVNEAVMIQLIKWNKMGFVADDFKTVEPRLVGLLKDAAISLKLLPKNVSPKTPKDLVGMTECNHCFSEFDWEEARWLEMKKSKIALCPNCGSQIETCIIKVPIELLSTSVSDQEDILNHLTTPAITAIEDNGLSFYLPTPTRMELEAEEDNHEIKNDDLNYLLENKDFRPKWFPRYAELFMLGTMSQSQIADELYFTDAELSDKLQKFKIKTQKHFGQFKAHSQVWTPTMNIKPAEKKAPKIKVQPVPAPTQVVFVEKKAPVAQPELNWALMQPAPVKSKKALAKLSASKNQMTFEF